MKTTTQQINDAIGESRGNARDALNITLARLEVANVLLSQAADKSDLLIEALEKIRQQIWDTGIPAGLLKAIDDVACNALAAAGCYSGAVKA